MDRHLDRHLDQERARLLPASYRKIRLCAPP